jgi:hypothetical protein
MSLESSKANGKSYLDPLRRLFELLVRHDFPKVAVCVAGIFASTFVMQLYYVAPKIVADYVAYLGFAMLMACAILLMISLLMVVFGRRKPKSRARG